MREQVYLKVQQLLAEEAWLLDARLWNEWLSLYTEDAVLWAPTWIDDGDLATDPETQLSFIYIEGKRGLRERIDKAKDTRAPASSPIPRTAHLLGPIQIIFDGDDAVITRCGWQTLIFDPKSRRKTSYAGTYEHKLIRGSEGKLSIQRKTIVIANDEVESKLDFFYI